MTTNPEVEAERRRAFRALLRNPLLAVTGETAEEYRLVRCHSDWLKEWLGRFPAWDLYLDGRLARLRKIPADLLDDTRPAVDGESGATFTRFRYALLCLTLASLEQMDRQTTLTELAHTVMLRIAGDSDLRSAGLAFDIGNYDQRRDFVHAVRFLVTAGVLSKVDGHETQFLNRGATDVLYGINRHFLAALLQLPHSPSAMGSVRTGEDSFAKGLERLTNPSTAGKDDPGGRIRARLVRALLDDPVLYFDDLNGEERDYLEHHRGYLLRQITEATGLIAEVRAEGIAMVDDTGELTDIRFPDEGVDGQIKLQLARRFAESCRNREPAIRLSEVEGHMRELLQNDLYHRRDPGGQVDAEIRLTEEALVRLRALRLIRVTPAGVVPLAACGRYAAPGAGGPGEEE